MAALYKAFVCHPGQVRRVNQDAVVCHAQQEEGIFLVADGMGGGYQGEKASGLLQQACEAWWHRRRAAAVPSSFVQALEELQEILLSCGQQIARITPAGAVCGSTAVLLWVQGEVYGILSIGDSRAYALRPRWGRLRLSQLTVDDVARPGEGWPPQELGRLTRYVGGPEQARAALRTGVWDPGDAFLLCSDGVYKVCPDACWGRLLGPALRRKDPAMALQKRSEEILRLGARDTFSAVEVQRGRP